MDENECIQCVKLTVINYQITKKLLRLITNQLKEIVRESSIFPPPTPLYLGRVASGPRRRTRGNLTFSFERQPFKVGGFKKKVRLNTPLPPTRASSDSSEVMDTKMDVDMNIDSSCKRIKRRTNLNKETKNIKRKCPSSTSDQIDANKKIPTTPKEPKINLHQKNSQKTSLHRIKTSSRENQVFNLMYMEKEMFNIGAGAHSINAFNKAEVQFNNYKEANKAILFKSLIEQEILTHRTHFPNTKRKKKVFSKATASISISTLSPTTPLVPAKFYLPRD
ncbi:hypothetical protein WN51_03637 [Melipona quadrifasciata]|uniref:Uncharacterized protein n=1 Tax=Melipona quadrifasciata TaxID=166423 RepID=A0A0M8ZX32_9HYME|nr:hypothetical protein WN51_03637 [Melipona quadrifasciata]